MEARSSSCRTGPTPEDTVGVRASISLANENVPKNPTVTDRGN